MLKRILVTGGAVFIGSFTKISNTPIWIEISENSPGIPAAAMPVSMQVSKYGDFQ